jgi:DNA sulfur modification protein DndC
MTTTPQQIIAEIQDLYLSDSLPWVVGYSGGKDSTASLQLIWNAIANLPADRRRFKPVHVISTDTMVENPVIALWVRASLLKMNIAASEQGLNIQSHPLSPTLENRFWVNLIGKGYPAPRPKFRWCTDRLKISASTKFIQELSEANGEAILVLGQRKGESQARDKVIEQYKSSTRNRLSRNRDPRLSRVWVYLPVETWSSDDVWEYIMQNTNPWNADNQELFDIYRGATKDAECPIVVDKSTPSCGDSRFGCYVCTMVTQDKSMAAMIVNDEAKSWMQPIMNFRDTYLTLDDRHFRDFRRLNGRITLTDYDDKTKTPDRLVHGPYTQDRRLTLFRELLKTQTIVQQTKGVRGVENLQLFPMDEIEEIRRIWVEEKGEIEDLVPQIYENVTKQKYPGKELDPMPLDANDLQLLKDIAAEWSAENLATNDDGAAAERASELYKLTRNLLAGSFHGLQNRKRSKKLDEVEKLLQVFSFIDERDAVAFAIEHDSKDADKNIEEEYDAAMEIVYEPTGKRDFNVIPIVSANIIA